MWLRTLVVTVMCFAVVAAAMVPTSPNEQTEPGRDSGAFLYVAMTMRDGGLPYRDVWDHKPPGVYVLNRLAILLSADPIRGLWVVRFGALGLAAVLGFVGLSRAWGDGSAAVGTLAWVVYLPLLSEGGNFTEEWALLPSFASLACVSAVVTGSAKRTAPWASSAGVAASTSFLLRPNLIGFHVGLCALLILSGLRSRGGCEALRRWSWIGLGTIVPLGAVTAVLWSEGVIRDAIDQVIRYNLVYTSEPGMSTVEVLARGLGLLATVKLPLWLSLAGLAGGLVIAVRRKLILQPTAMLATMVLEGLLLSMAGRAFRHYFLSLLPYVAVASALGTNTLVGLLARSTSHGRARWVASVLVAAVACAFLVTGLIRGVEIELGRIPSTRLDEVKAEIARVVGPRETLLVWGAEAELNVVLDRRAPTRYVYQYPLFKRGYTTPGHWREFVDSLRRRPPAVIVDAALPAAVPRLGSDIGAEVTRRAAIHALAAEEFEAWFKSMYELSGEVPVGHERWRLFVRRPSPLSESPVYEKSARVPPDRSGSPPSGLDRE